MKCALITVICILSVFAAIGLACAVRIGLRRPAQADPFFHPFGDMPGFTAEQLRRIAPPVRTRDPLRRSFANRVDLYQASELPRVEEDGALTECAMERAARRYAREGRTIRIAFAPAGQDFNDVLRTGPEGVTPGPGQFSSPRAACRIRPARCRDCPSPIRRWLDLSQPNSTGLALRPDADGGWPAFRSRLASIGNFVATPLRRRLRGGRDVSA